MKICIICKESKNETNFHKDSSRKDGLNPRCKECRKPKNPYIKKYATVKEYNKVYREKNKEFLNKTSKNYYHKNKTKCLESSKQWCKINPDKVKVISKRSYEKNKLKQLQYKKDNRDKINNYERNKRKTDVNYKLADNLRRRLNKALQNNTKSLTINELLGCSIDELKLHLQNTAIQNGYFEFDINNYSGQEYHIDHIKPCNSFDLSKEEEQRKCFHYSNLQILTAKENLQKSDN